MIAASLIGAVSAPVVGTGVVQAVSDLVVTVGAPAEQLAEAPTVVPVSVTATNPTGGSGENGYNGSFVVLVPAGAVFDSGAFAPKSQATAPDGRVAFFFENIGDIQEGSSLTLDFNVRLPAAQFPVGTRVAIEAIAGASTNPRAIPDFLPGPGKPGFGGDVNGQATGTGSTLLTPIRIDKLTTIGAEDEVLRGVHDQQEVYTLEVTNNGQGATNTVVVEDFVPAEYEYLGCGDVDHSTGVEYPGAPRLDANGVRSEPDPPVDCLTPTLVEMVVVTGGLISSSASGTTVGRRGPSSTMADGVYTHVVWNVTNFAAGQVKRINYKVGVPMRENVYAPTMFTPGGALDPIANLDNNTGPFTTESNGSEQIVRNWASAAGVYAGAVAPGFNRNTDSRDADDHLATIEDISIHKFVSVPTPLVHGVEIDYELEIETSEYRRLTNVVVTDDGLSNGQCPHLGGTRNAEVVGGFPGGDNTGECVGGTAPSRPFQTVRENADGTWTMVWDSTTAPFLANMAPNSRQTITFSSIIRSSFQLNGEADAPVNGADKFDNDVSIQGVSNLVPNIADDPAVPTGTLIQDVSAVGFGAGSANLDKSVSKPVPAGTTLSCDTATYVQTDPQGTPSAVEDPPYAYRIGDRVCFRLGVDYIGDLNFRNPRVDDFLPSGMTFERLWGSPANSGGTGVNAGATPRNEVAIASVAIEAAAVDEHAISWFMGARDPDTVGGAFQNDLFVSSDGHRFEVVFSAIVVIPPADRTTADLKNNLQKFTVSNIDNETISVRDSADFSIVQPHLVTTKAASTAVATQGVPIGYTSTIRNDFEAPPGSAPAFANDFAAAVNVSAWDVLPAGISCADVSSIALSSPGTTTCTNGIGPSGRSVIAATVNRINPQASANLTYNITLPTNTAAGATLTNDFGVRNYRGTTSNDGSAANDPVFTPSNNIDPSLNATANLGPARSQATVRTPLPVIEKDQQSSFGDSINARNATPAITPDEAAVGELVQYTVKGITIPEGTTLFNARLADVIPAGLRFVRFDSVTLDNGNGTVTDLIAAPGGFTLANAGQNVALTFPPTYNNPTGSGNDSVIMVFSAIVTDTATATAGTTFVNTATLTFENAPTGGQRFDVPSNATTLTAIEPQLQVDIDTTLADGSLVLNPTCDDVRGNDTPASDDPDGTPTDGCDVQSGDVLWQKIAVTNTGTSNAYDATVVSVVPLKMTPLATPNGAPVADGGTVTGPSGSVGTWDLATRTITWDPATVPALAGPIEPGAAPLVLDFHAVLDPSANLSQAEDFTTTVAIPEYFALPAAQRNPDTPSYGDPAATNPNDRGAVDPDQDTVEVHFPQITVDKVAVDDFSDARLGEPFRFELRITNSDATATAFDVDVVDVLPADWAFDAGSATPSAPAVAGQTLTWTDVFDIAPGSTTTIAYTATPDAAALATIAATGYDGGAGPESVPYTNTVDVAADDESGASANADGPFIADADETVFIRRTDLEVAKSISPVELDADPTNGPYFYGSFVEYTVEVTNQGPDDATEVAIDDLLANPPLQFVSVTSASVGSYDDATGLWTIPNLADGDTATLVFRARIADLGSITNVAQVGDAGQFDGDSTPGNDAGAEDDQDQVTVTATPTGLGDYVFLDLDRDGTQDATEPGIPGVPVTITFTDPGGTPRQYSTTTNEQGFYSLPPLFVDELTGNTVGTPTLTDITVTIDTTAPVLAGLVPTDGPQSDVDGGADSTSTQQIDPGDPSSEIDPDGRLVRLDVDFGYWPIGQTIGDRVWWDQDASADPTDGDPATAVEYGLPGVTLTATWYGFDGLPGTGDEIVFTTTTSDGAADVDGDGNPDPAGEYLFRNVPPGSYDIEVDTTSLPSDLTDQTFDLDGVATPSFAQDVQLGAGENRRDVDFSYVGPGEIGDTVWFDADADGVQDPGEPGISGVVVTVHWFGPDGIEGTADDATIPLVTSDGTDDVDGDGTTDPAGTYFVANLPTGDYRVTVDDTTLPGSMTQTYDFDDATDPTNIVTGHTSLTTLTTVDPSDRDQDFGYTGDLRLGDLVWFDVAGDGNPSPDAGDGDLAIAGVPVTVTWAGNDGVFGTPDDFVTTVVTSDGSADTDGDGTPEALGEYLVAHLPDGAYRVEVDTGGVLTDLGIIGPTFDFDGGGDPAAVLTPNTSATTLAGDDDLDQDFSYTGIGRIGDTIWLDIDEDGVQDPGEPGFSGVVVQLTWGGPDGVLGDDPATAEDESLDDQMYTTTTSDGTVDVDGDGTADPVGAYGFDHLPFGDFEVSVDPDGSTLPAGVAQVSDPDATLDGTSTVALDAAAPIDLDQDFGYHGLGSVGDTVWLDLDADGVQDAADPVTGNPAEPGIASVDVTVRWIGTDGTAGTADDYVTTITTSDGTQDVDGDGTIDPRGYYRVPALPFGTVIVTVDASTGPLPALTQTYDALGALDHRSIITLASDDPLTPADEANDVDQDFGYVGGASMGDLVFYDRDANGAPAPNGIDTPLPGVTIDVTWAGVDGIIGDDPTTPADESVDDLLFTPVTDAAGNWNLTGLPPGEYRVTVDATTLPPGIDVPTFDRDGTADGDTPVTLGPTDAITDVDFSYTGAGAVGDTVFVDFDADGVQDPEDVGLGGITVTVSYTAPDGTTISVPVVTSDGLRDVDGDGTADPIGTYFVGNLPFDVPITITVDAGTLPDGLVGASDPDGTVDDESTVTLTAAAPVDLDQDFGYNGPGRLGDTVFYDANGFGNGVPDPATGDVGLPNVTVTATWAGPDGVFGDDPATLADESLDDTTLTTTTDADGRYLFESLPFGQWQVTVDAATLPAGTEPVFDPDGAGDLTSLTSLDDATAEDLDQDFSVTGTASLGDLVWVDLDADGVQDAGEPGLAGVGVVVEYTDPITGATVTLSTTTSDGTTDVDGDGTNDPVGSYFVDHLPAGDFTVSYVAATLPAGYGAASDPDDPDDPEALLDGIATVTLGEGESIRTVDFGVRPVATIAGVVFQDTDGDGLQGPGEPGIAGVTVVITDSAGVVFEAVTAADGTYSVDDVGAGVVTVDVDDTTLPSGVELSTGNDPHTVTAPAGSTTTAEPIGYALLTSLSGTIWFDQDGAADLDAGEPRFAGITVELVAPDGSVVATTRTDGSGFYQFTEIPTGEYVVRVVTSTLPPGLAQTFDVDGTLDGRHPIVLGPGGSTANDFGYTGTGSVTDAVWIDANGNGVADVGESRLSGVVYTLTWAGPDGTLGTSDDVVYRATSDADGRVSFPRLAAGLYRMQVDPATVPAGVRLAGPVSTTFNLAPGQALAGESFPALLAPTALPRTGASPMPFARAAACTIGIGVLLALIGRRRRPRVTT